MITKILCDAKEMALKPLPQQNNSANHSTSSNSTRKTVVPVKVPALAIIALLNIGAINMQKNNEENYNIDIEYHSRNLRTKLKETQNEKKRDIVLLSLGAVLSLLSVNLYHTLKEDALKVKISDLEARAKYYQDKCDRLSQK